MLETTQNKRTKPPTVKPARLSDVARLAGVSASTVSRALNTPDRVGEKTLARVHTAVENLGYVPFGAGRALRTFRTHTIGMCIPDLEFSMFSETVDSIQSTLNDSNYMLLLSLTRYDEDLELEEVRTMLGRGVDGLVLVGAQHHPSLLAMLRERQVPHVITWTCRQDMLSVGFDHRRAMNIVGNYLTELGHRRIGAIMPAISKNDRMRDRIDGLRDALVSRGLALPDEYVLDMGSDLVEARQGMSKLLSLPEPPTAVACANDMIAAGALLECRSRRIIVPEEMSIVGYCQMQIGQAQEPVITTVRTPIEEMGRKAARFLLDRIAGVSNDIHLDIPTELVIGGSTGPALAFRPKAPPRPASASTGS